MPPTTALQVADLPADEAVAAIRAGLPASSFTSLAKVLGLEHKVLARKLNIPVRSLTTWRTQAARLSPENTEKLVRTARIYRLARKIYTSDVAVAEWLLAPESALNGTQPVDLLDTDTGAREVESVLYGIAYGNVM